MSLIRPIITSIIIIYVRIRIVNTIFSQQKLKITLTLKIFGLAIIIVGSLLIYTYLLWYIGQQQLALTHKINPQNILVFIAYCTVFAILITMIFQNRYKKIAQILLIGSLFFVAVAYGGWLTGINILILYYIISAYAEEYMKYSAGNNMWLANQEDNPSNLIFFCILIALWFSIIENIAYIGQSLLQQQTINITNLIVGRGLISTLIHVVSTGLIAFITIKLKTTTNRNIPIVLWIIWGLAIHSIYNIGLYYQTNYITIPLVVLAFFLLTYLTFQSDIIYKQPK